jgi:2EXR family
MATNSTSHSNAISSLEESKGTLEASSGNPALSSQDYSDYGRRTFTRFPKLPLELRRKIWKEACSVPRLVDLWANFPFTLQMGFDATFRPMAYDSYSSKYPPAILHASHESRIVALENYRLCFGWEINEVSDRAKLRASIPAEIYVNWEYDIICPIGTAYDEWDECETDYFHYLHNSDLKSNGRMRCIALSIHQIMDQKSRIPRLTDMDFELHEILLYQHPDRLSNLYGKPVRLEFENIDRQVEEGGIARQMADRLINAKNQVSNFIQDRISNGVVVEGWTRPSITLMRLIVHEL